MIKIFKTLWLGETKLNAFLIIWFGFSLGFGWQLLPEPQATWQITYDPGHALVTEMGD